jgi:hypothetical protein
MANEFSVARNNLEKLIQEYSPLGELSNEAQTRFSFIDKFLEDCLEWPRSEIKVERYEDGNRTDYECGTPRMLIVEAKKSQVPLKLPPKRNKCRVGLSSLIAFDESTASAIRQVQTYGQSRGVQITAVSNGPQLIAFLASRVDGVSPLDGDALVFDGYDELLKNFSLVYESLAKAGVEERRLIQTLSKDAPATLPSKLSAYCLNYFDHKYSNQFQESLRNAAALVIEDLGGTASLEKEFLASCYCESGPLSQYSLVGKNLLSARYAALFPSDQAGSRIEHVNPKKTASAAFSQQVLHEALARRPVVLVGDVGVGKTTFLKHLILVSGKENFNKVLCITLDLGNKASLSRSPRDALLNEIERTLREDLGVNLSASSLVEDLYKIELKDFDEGVNGQLREISPNAFLEERLKYIRELLARRENHLRLTVAHTAKAKRLQSVFVIDNADQRNLSIQQDAFLIAQELATNWSSLVFLALRPQTFHASKRSGTISAYPTKIFVIPPPKLEDAIQKRLVFALEMAKGRVPIQQIDGVTLHVDSLAKLIQALLKSLESNRELYEFIVNVSGGNVRVAVELVSKYLGSPNIESDRIVKTITETGKYWVPLHEFSKAALLGDYSHFQEEASAATNLYSVVYRDQREHFLSLLIIGYLSWDGAKTAQTDGFVSQQTLMDEMQANGFTQDQTTVHLQRLTRRKLIESTERRLLDTGAELQELGLPESFRITSNGAYHLKRWCVEFHYLEAVCFDTPIFDDSVRQILMESVNDDRLLPRYKRASSFRDYLDSTWKGLKAQPYFDWNQTRLVSNQSFMRVEKRLRDLQLLD